jgi:hypothetical protein
MRFPAAYLLGILKKGVCQNPVPHDTTQLKKKLSGFEDNNTKHKPGNIENVHR